MSLNIFMLRETLRAELSYPVTYSPAFPSIQITFPMHQYCQKENILLRILPLERKPKHTVEMHYLIRTS